MGTEKTDGGPAFPVLGNVAHNSDWVSDDGMSLRDWFAERLADRYVNAIEVWNKKADQ